MKELELFTGLVKYILNGVTCEGGWDVEPGAQKETNPLNTAEALCGLISIRYPLRVAGKLPENFDKVVNKAVEYLFSTQLESGGWATGSAYRHKNINIPKGNTVSTCLALWSLLLYNDLIRYDHRIISVVEKAISFFIQCKTNDGLYVYSPDLSEISVVSTAYVFLAFTQILSCHNIRDNLTHEKYLEAQNVIKDMIDCINDEAFIKEAKKQRISAILIYLSIQHLINNKTLAEKTLNKIERPFHNVLLEFSLENCITPYSELQVVREKGKTGRDFTHYVPVWMLMIYSLCDSKSDIGKYKSQVLNVVINNIKKDFDGVSIGNGNKRTIWATGITLFSLSFFAYNFDLINLLKQEGIQMSDNRKVFIVHGRDLEFKQKIVNFLRALSLQPLEWDYIAGETGKATPTTHEIIVKGFEIAQVIIVLLTGDDEGKLKDIFHQDTDNDLEKTISSQPRLNVVYEAGLAFGMNPTRTLVVGKPEKLRKISDVDGFNYILYDGSPEKRNAMVTRLKAAGCLVETTSSDWLKV